VEAAHHPRRAIASPKQRTPGFEHSPPLAKVRERVWPARSQKSLAGAAVHARASGDPRLFDSARLLRPASAGEPMAIDLYQTKGTPLEKQRFTWRDLVQPTYSKLDDDAFTRVRVILLNGIESEALRFGHACARMNRALQEPLARVRRVEQHQQTLVNWLNPADQSPLETTIGFEQVAVEVTASVAQAEPDEYLAQVYRFGLLEDFDHLYRYSALYDRLEGKDANTLLHSYTDIVPGRPTSVEHRAPIDDLRRPYDRVTAQAITKLHAYTIMAAEHQTHDYYMTIGPTFADPLARMLYAEIASIEEQHVTQYESIIDANESWLEKWLLHEANEIYVYWSAVEYESNPHIKKIWERFLDYELGHFQLVCNLFENMERRDAQEIVPARLPEPIRFESQRDFVREVLAQEVHLRANGPDFVWADQLSPDSPSVAQALQLNAEGSPSETVAAGWKWNPGTELAPDPGEVTTVRRRPGAEKGAEKKSGSKKRSAQR
jgi:rubrerythrin